MRLGGQVIPFQFCGHLLFAESTSREDSVAGELVILRRNFVLNVLGSLSELTIQLVLDTWQHLGVLESELWIQKVIQGV